MENSSANASEVEGDPIHNPMVQVYFCVLYTTVFVLGICGNVLTCYVVFANKTMQTVTNFFITNLALADILLCALSVIFTPLYTFLGQWYYGAVLCHFLPYSQGTSVYVSALTLTSIAVDRYFVIIYPFRPRMKVVTCCGIICGIWLFSLLATLPYGLYMELTVDNGTFCEENWPQPEQNRQLFSGITGTMQFVLPFLIIAFCYTKVSLKLNDRARFKPGTKNSRKEEMDRERKKRTNRMLIAMVLIFGISWLPLNFINLAMDFELNWFNLKYYNLTFFICHSIAMTSTCYNPFLYAWLNDNFRKEFKQVLPGFDSSNKRSSKERSGWRSERLCNGNETVQESLLQSTTIVRRASSIKVQLEETQKHLRDRGDSIETEEVTIPKVSYISNQGKVNLHLDCDETSHLSTTLEDSRSSPVKEGRIGADGGDRV